MGRLLLFILIGYVLYLILRGRSGLKTSPKEVPKGEDTVKDPVCGMYLTKDDAVVGTLEGEKFYFCSMSCLESFRQQLEQQANK